MSMVEPMPSTGGSLSWVQQGKNVLNIFDKFRTSDPALKTKYPHPFMELPEDVVCDQEIYSLFATYLLDLYKIEGGPSSGNGLMHDSALNYLHILINKGASRFKVTGTDASKLFYTCLDPKASTESAKWLQGMKAQMLRKWFGRTKMSSDCHDNSAPPLYLEHVRKMTRAYAKEGGAEAADRIFTLTAAHLAAGACVCVLCVCARVRSIDRPPAQDGALRSRPRPRLRCGCVRVCAGDDDPVQDGSVLRLRRLRFVCVRVCVRARARARACECVRSRPRPGRLRPQ